MWHWLTETNYNHGFILRVIVKAAILFGVCNFTYMLIPSAAVAQATLYNTVFPGRERFPFANQPSVDNNVTITDIDALFASHEVSTSADDDEFRVFLIGDSATWGYGLSAENSYAALINQQVGDDVQVYNLGYPIVAGLKDLLILEYAKRHEPDLVIWLITPRTLVPSGQQEHAIITSNQQFADDVLTQYNIDITPEYPEQSWWDATLIGQRQTLFDQLRLQLNSVAWAGIQFDHKLPDEPPIPVNDFEADTDWRGYKQGDAIDLWTVDVLDAVMNEAGVPVILVNEPIYRADGENSDLHYNSFYPRWVYDQYREFIAQRADENDWTYYDWWDAVPPTEFIDPLHMQPDGAQQVSEMLLDAINDYMETN